MMNSRKRTAEEEVETNQNKKHKLTNNEPVLGIDYTCDGNVDTRIEFKARINNKWSFLSNFYPYVKNIQALHHLNTTKPVLFEHDGVQFHSSEQFYQWEKYASFDWKYASLLMREKDALVIKKMSGKGAYIEYKSSQPGNTKTKASLKREFDISKNAFNANRAINTMRTALYCKFTQNEDLKKELLATGDRWISENGRMKREYWARTGSDMLGKLLMELRHKLRQSN